MNTWSLPSFDCQGADLAVCIVDGVHDFATFRVEGTNLAIVPS